MQLGNLKTETEKKTMKDMAMKKSNLAKLIWLMLLFFCISANCAKADMKGNLNKDEIDFVEHTFYPILIRSKLCISADDCRRHDYLICLSYDSLSCDVYGVTNEEVIKDIFLSILNSGLRTKEITFWASKYHKKSFFEKPLLNFIDRTGGK